jgi:2,3-bisphosphoglycerate-dependent phosphoglycerate mutase
MHLEGMSPDDIAEFNVPTGVPRRYEFTNDMAVASVGYLGDPTAIAAATDAVARQASK